MVLRWQNLIGLTWQKPQNLVWSLKLQPWCDFTVQCTIHVVYQFNWTNTACEQCCMLCMPNHDHVTLSYRAWRRECTTCARNRRRTRSSSLLTKRSCVRSMRWMRAAWTTACLWPPRRAAWTPPLWWSHHRVRYRASNRPPSETPSATRRTRASCVASATPRAAPCARDKHFWPLFPELAPRPCLFSAASSHHQYPLLVLYFLTYYYCPTTICFSFLLLIWFILNFFLILVFLQGFFNSLHLNFDNIMPTFPLLHCWHFMWFDYFEFRFHFILRIPSSSTLYQTRFFHPVNLILVLFIFYYKYLYMCICLLCCSYFSFWPLRDPGFQG